jgi:uncharacterized membrane protein
MQKRRKEESVQNVMSDAAMGQLYRGELGRSDRWRTRLDTTTNWALTTTAAVISFAFGATQSTHVTLLAGIWMVVTFLLIEARRYRYYDLWHRRVRLIEDGYWAPLLRHEPVDPDSLRELAREMERPQIQLSFLSALQTRLNRAYGSLLLVLFLAWFVKVFSHPRAVATFDEFVYRAHIGPISGWVVTIAMVSFTFSFFALFVISRFVRAPMGELQSRPRPRTRPMWEAFYRPYVVPTRRGRKSTPSRPPPSSSHH